MSGQSGFMKKVELYGKEVEKETRWVIRQYMTDMFTIALNDPRAMGKDVLGYKRLERLMKVVEEYYDYFFDAIRDEPETDYLREKMDERIRKIVPLEHFCPHDERYQWTKKVDYRTKKERYGK